MAHRTSLIVLPLVALVLALSAGTATARSPSALHHRSAAQVAAQLNLAGTWKIDIQCSPRCMRDVPAEAVRSRDDVTRATALVTIQRRSIGDVDYFYSEPRLQSGQHYLSRGAVVLLPRGDTRVVLRTHT